MWVYIGAANGTEQSVRGGDAAMCQITLSTCWLWVMTQSWLRPSAVVTDASGCQVTNEPRATAAAAGGDVDDDDDDDGGGGGGRGRGPCDAAVTRCASVCDR